ncbi:MAG: efflux RND transporter periplasmic adaptor subunit [Terracidiphilus sp.]|jgi:RND family efflux transporter MFP subunit
MKSHFYRRDLLITAATLVVAAALPLGSGCNSKPEAQAAAAERPAASTPAPPPSVPPPAAPDAGQFTTTGPLVAEQQADIAAERNGRVVQVAVQMGDHVKRDQLLALLDDRALKSAANAQKARIAAAQAAVTNWETEEMSVKNDLRRADGMRANNIISEEDWEHVKYKLDETIALVARYRSEEAAAEADLITANLQLEQSRIVAPFAGVVGRSSVRPAQEVKAGDVLFWITAEAPLRVLFTVPETVMAAFTTGKALDLTTADYPGLHQPGRILRVSPVVDPASGSVQVIGVVASPSPLMKPGMQMQVRLAP